MVGLFSRKPILWNFGGIYVVNTSALTKSKPLKKKHCPIFF